MNTQSECILFSKQKDELSRQLFDIKHRMENERAAREDAEKQKQREHF